MKGYRGFKIETDTDTVLLTTAETKTFLKVDVSDDDTLIDNLIQAATLSCEEYTNRFFIERTLKQYAPTWKGIQNLLKSPVASVTHIKYYDNADSLQTLSTDIYSLNNVLMPSKIELKDGQDYPDIADRWDAIEVQYVVGVASAANVSEAIKQAVLLTVGTWYQNRQSVVTGTQVNEIPMTSKYLLDQYKIQVVR